MRRFRLVGLRPPQRAVPSMPRPPAFETAATSSGGETAPIPACWIGTVQLISSVKRVLSIGHLRSVMHTSVTACVTFAGPAAPRTGCAARTFSQRRARRGSAGAPWSEPTRSLAFSVGPRDDRVTRMSSLPLQFPDTDVRPARHGRRCPWIGALAREGVMDGRSQIQRRHVFAINASPEFLNVVRELFQEEGYNVTTSNFAPNSFAQIEALQPDALIIDIAIGQEAGWELLEQLEADADTAGIPVLVVSTDPRLLAHAEAHAARYGTHRFLAKPLDLDAMLQAIQEMIGEA